MKKIISITIVLGAICLGTLSAQVKPSSAKVEKQFSLKFKAASNVSWEAIENNVWLARFKHDGATKLAYFSQAGEFLMEGRLLGSNEIPETVVAGLNKAVASYEKKSGGVRIIQVFELNGQKKRQYFANMGNEEILLSIMVNQKGRATVIRSKKIERKSTTNPVIASL